MMIFLPVFSRFSSLFAARDVSRGGETSLAAKREEKRMFSQTTPICVVFLRLRQAFLHDEGEPETRNCGSKHTFN